MKVRKAVSLTLGTGLLVGAALAPGMASAQEPAPHPHRGRDPRPGVRPVLVDLRQRRQPGRQGHGTARRHGQLLRARGTTFDINAMAQLITAAVGKNPTGPGGLDPGCHGARARHQERRRCGHPGHLRQLRL